MKSLEKFIKEEAHRIGYILAGITTTDSPPHAPVFEKWLSLGRHASMDYLTRERAISARKDPRTLMPECRSILVLAAAYPDPTTFADSKSGREDGRIASYARGQDYHTILSQKNLALMEFIQKQVGRPLVQRAYTDTGPILERDLAQRAGLGWIGKNTCLINPKLGSYLFLSEILLDLDLEPDQPFLYDRCGKCTRCMDACPTRCILPDRTLDARRCISYLTIENRGDIPRELRKKMGNWIFGCDICQMVCPWNRFAINSSSSLVNLEPNLSAPDIMDDLSLSQDEFAEKFSESPIHRAKWRGYIRNILVAVGNTGDGRFAEKIEALMNDPDPIIREHALWARENILMESS